MKPPVWKWSEQTHDTLELLHVLYNGFKEHYIFKGLLKSLITFVLRSKQGQTVNLLDDTHGKTVLEGGVLMQKWVAMLFLQG